MRCARSNPSRNANHESGVDLLHAAAAACPHGLMIEERGTVQYANRAYARLAGFRSPEEVIGKKLARLTVPLRVPHKKGSDRPIYDTLHFEFSHGRRTIGLHVVRDVSERRALESRLLESEKMEALGRLVGGVAHDFNNILTAITLHSDLLRERFGNGVREIDEVREASKRGGDLVRQLLTFARQHPAASSVVSVSKIVSSMSSVLEPLIGEDVDFQTDFAACTDYVRADPAQLQQVVLNLVMNARDALGPKGGRISIRTSRSHIDGREAARRGLNAGEYVSLVVEDSGCGMEDEVRARIFEPFFTTKEHGTGTGLGMSMVYGIVKQAGGSVTVASKVGKGTRVTALLPRAAMPLPVTRTVEKECAREGHETVLLAEDDAGVRASIAALLTGRGYHVLQARDGFQAVRTARAYKPAIHLLLTDVVMPRMNGVDAASNICQFHPEAKVLFMSGYPAKAATVALPEALLFKPFSRTALEQKVRETLEERSPASKAAHGQSAVRGT